jgi:small basic protein
MTNRAAGLAGSAAIVAAGLFIGLLVGFKLPVVLPAAFAHYLSIALLAALDSAFGGMRSGLEGRFDLAVFITGLLSNAVLAGLLTYFGDKMGVPLFDAALFAFGYRIFQNLAAIRHLLLEGWRRRRPVNLGGFDRPSAGKASSSEKS